MKKPLRFWFKLFLFLVILFSVQSCLFSRIDRTPYQQTAYYAKFQKNVAALSKDTNSSIADTLKVGWAKATITPAYPVPLAGYGQRWGKKYTSIHDSLWVRAFVFDNGVQKAAWVTMDLLIVPPEVTKLLTLKLPSIGFSIDDTYLTATHSHHSIGAWADRLVGRLIAGKYDERIVAMLTNQVIKAIQQADRQKQTASLGIATYPCPELVSNRVIPGGPTDSLLRILKIRQVSGKTAVIATFSAHATNLRSRELVLSRDYPGAFVDSLEKQPQVDFAAFGAGAVGSHGPRASGEHFEKVTYLAHFLSQKIMIGFADIPMAYSKSLKIHAMRLPLREPQWRISENWKLRSWVFNWLYGKYPASLKAMQIGNTVWVGMPCDFSGELVKQIQSKPAYAHIPLFVTSFNGGYIGYVTNDAYYDRDHYETRAMNWFGPQNGAYLSEAVEAMIQGF